jgi:hypothetical protein
MIRKGVIPKYEAVGAGKGILISRSSGLDYTRSILLIYSHRLWNLERFLSTRNVWVEPLKRGQPEKSLEELKTSKGRSCKTI